MAQKQDAVDEALHKAFDAFAAQTHVNRNWLEGDVLHVYVRQSHRMWKSKTYPTFDLATFSIENKQHQRKGYSRSFINHVIEVAKQCVPPRLVYMENVFSFDWRANLIANHGFEHYPYTMMCLILHPEQVKQVKQEQQQAGEVI